MLNLSESKYILPAEWEKHSAVWLAWPYDTITFPGEHLEKVELRYVEIIKALSQSEVVKLLVLDENMKIKVEKFLNSEEVSMENIKFFITDYADVWLRDYGPMFVKNYPTGENIWIKWQYDAYTKKFPILVKDNEVFKNLKGKIDKPMQEIDMVLEGGAVEQNGAGTLIVTRQCLLESGRNPNLSKEQIENNLKKYLGVNKIIWLDHGLANDHTDGHTDDIVKFISKDTILCAYEEDENSENHLILKKNFEDLEKSVDQDGKKFNLIKLPMAHIRYDNDKPFEAGGSAPASYTNFYIGNNVVLMPSFEYPNDSKAFEIIKSFFPDKKIVQIDCKDIVYGGGAIHCMTQQEPA